MSAAIKEIIYSWAVPHLGARYIVTSAYTDNIGSQKTMLKNGFAFVKETPTGVDLTHKGRANTDVLVYELRL